MMPKPFALTGDQSKPIADSVETLLRTEKRLEKLTHGEIDAVTDQQGHTVLLRPSQEHLLKSEAVRQTAILDALPAHIALLDKQGFIVSVNHAWQRFAEANSLQKNSHGVGMNYLAICDAATACDAILDKAPTLTNRAFDHDLLPTRHKAIDRPAAITIGALSHVWSLRCVNGMAQSCFVSILARITRSKICRKNHQPTGAWTVVEP